MEPPASEQCGKRVGNSFGNERVEAGTRAKCNVPRTCESENEWPRFFRNPGSEIQNAVEPTDGSLIGSWQASLDPEVSSGQ